jgi:hypothetical protein
MNELRDYRRTLPDVSYEIATIRAELKFRKFMRALKAAFNPEQPRDEDGRWTDSGLTSPKAGSDAAADSAGGDRSGARKTPLDIIAARRQFSLAECEAQYKRDTFFCTMVGLPSCHRQAAQRYAACLGGTQIPPLNY